MMYLKGYRTYICLVFGGIAEVASFALQQLPSSDTYWHQILHAVTVLCMAGAAYFRSKANTDQ